MPLPETIRVKYTEEEAEYVSIRPLVQQEFRGAELVDMILSVTGKDVARIQQILRSGTIVFHSYRYWWQGFGAESAALAGILVRYPDAEPSREFQAGECSEVILESSGAPAAHTIRLRRDAAGKKRLLRSRSFWDCLMDLAGEAAPAYREYSYALRGDVYWTTLTRERVMRLGAEAERYAPRALRVQLGVLPSISQIAYVCPRARGTRGDG
jgi:hypothetical protein